MVVLVPARLGLGVLGTVRQPTSLDRGSISYLLFFSIVARFIF